MVIRNIYRKSVVFIGRRHEEKFLPLGTGFIVSVERYGRAVCYLVTARHVIAGNSLSERGATGVTTIRLNKEGGGAEFFDCSFGDWAGHPQEDQEATDIFVMEAAWLDRSKHIFARIDLDSNALTDERSQQFDVNVGDEIFTVGLFAKHHGKAQNVPVVRIGNLALMPSKEEQVKTKLGWMTAYLVEVRSISGLSGSPVFVHFPPFRTTNGKMLPAFAEGGMLVGLMHGHFDADGVDAVTEERGGEQSSVHTGMGVVVPVQRIIETIGSVENKKVPAASDESRSTLLDSAPTDSMIGLPPGGIRRL